MKNKKIDVIGKFPDDCDTLQDEAISYITNTGLRKDELLSIKRMLTPTRFKISNSVVKSQNNKNS